MKQAISTCGWQIQMEVVATFPRVFWSSHDYLDHLQDKDSRAH